MANYSIKIDLLKLKGGFVTNIKGRTSTKQCLCIPIEGSGLFPGKQGCYLNLTAIEMQNPRFEDTHCLKVQYDRAVYDTMSQEEKNSQPIVGGLHTLVRRQAAVDLTANDNPFVANSEEELPF